MRALQSLGGRTLKQQQQQQDHSNLPYSVSRTV
eukprot:COSAG04_NODE_32216_length_252_cov_0.718954_1_plen_32_part_01